MKKRSWKLVGLVLLAVFALGVGPALGAFVVTESSVYHSDYVGYYELSFTVTNGDYTDIREFAVGNNDAGSVGVKTNASSPPSSLTDGMIAYRAYDEVGGVETSHWKTASGRALTWLDGADGFADYDQAFLYTSWGWGDSGYSGYLDSGFTNGYWGNTQQLASPFAAYSPTEGTITGKTSAVPIPGALWLLSSGLFGLVTIRRRKQG